MSIFRLSPAELSAQLERYKTEIDREIEVFLLTYIEERYREEVRYILEGGKRLRGALILILCDLLRGDRQKALRAAVALEAVHAASLAIDDIVDGDLRRRERTSAWMELGVGKTVVLTNLIISNAIKHVSPIGQEAITEVLETWNDMSKGELLDSYIYEANYEDVVKFKTSSLFSLALTLGALVSDKRDIIPYLKDLANDIGMLYQIIDDFIDTVNIEQKGGKERIALEKFLAWIGIRKENNININELSDKVKKVLQKYVDIISQKSLRLQNNNLRELFSEIPRYLIDKLIKEANLSVL